MARQGSRSEVRGFRKGSLADRQTAHGAVSVERLEQRALLSVTAGLPPTSDFGGVIALPVASPTQGVVTKFALLAPTNVPNGVPVRIGITAVNANGYPVRTFTGTANVATSDSAATLPASVTFREGRAFLTATFVTPGQQTITLTSATDPTIVGTATTTVAEPLVAAKFGVLLPRNVPSGVAVRGTIVALTADGRPVPTYSGTVNLSSSDTAATLPASVNVVKGVATFQATFVTAGAQTVSAVDSVDSTIQGTATTTVAAPQVLTSFRLLLKPSTFTGKSTEAHVIALDAAGRPMRNFTGPVTLSSSDAAAVLPATVNFREGKAEFRVTFNTVGSQTLTVKGGPDDSITATATTNVLATPVATKFAVLLPRSVRAGATLFVPLIALDANGRPVPTFSGDVTLASSDPAAVLPTTATFKEGRAVVRVTFNTAGVQTLTVTSVLDTAIVGTATTTVASKPSRPRR